LPIDTNHPTDPSGAYGLSKLITEKIARRFALVSKMSVICLRPVLIVQPSMIFNLAYKVAKAENTPLPSSKSRKLWAPDNIELGSSRTFIDPRDAAYAFRQAFLKDNIPWKIFYIANPKTYSRIPTLELVKKEFNVTPELMHSSHLFKDANMSIYDISDTIKDLNWLPKHNWKELVKQTCDYRAE